MSNAETYATAVSGAADMRPDDLKIVRQTLLGKEPKVVLQAWVESDGALAMRGDELEIEDVPKLIAWLRENYE